MHHFNVESLEECFNMLDGKNVVGTDGVDKEQYRRELNENPGDLIERMKRMAYRPKQVFARDTQRSAA